MGLTSRSCEFLFHVKKRYGIALGRTLTLGRLQTYFTPGQAKSMAAHFGVRFDAKEEWRPNTGFCESFLLGLGAEKIDSMDVSGYEGATLIHDLNTPVPDQLHGQYDFILDGGTIEHVFHFPNAIRSCMDMLAIGGHYAAITPGDNQMGHGFYQFSPELYFRIFSSENGFEVCTMLLQSGADWLEISDPKKVGYRGSLVSSASVMIYILARKTHHVEGFHIPQQSDYVEAWSVVDSIRSDTARAGEGRMRHLVRRYLPVPVKTLLRRIKRAFAPRVDVEGLKGVDGTSYKRIRITE